ncbi:hypothetical protein ABES58_04675 [Paenibacillus lautus]|uniref:hypothetical protein n=1 Tax=Paenibacillus lautus TaxID=1401 RepID=UPI003D2DC449
MKVIVKRGLVDDGTKIYGYGEIVPGLSEKEARRLIKTGLCEAILSEEEPSIPDDSLFPQLPLQGNVILSIEDFAELKADDQKSHLKALEIEPAGKEEDRIAQYEEWYAEQVTADDED